MDITELKEIVSKIKYKKGWELKAFLGSRSIFYGLIPDEGGNMIVAIRWFAEDSTKLDGNTVPINGPYLRIEKSDSESSIVRKILENIVKCEIHESMEFFRYNDKIIYDPHQPFNAGVVKQHESQAQMRMGEPPCVPARNGGPVQNDRRYSGAEARMRARMESYKAKGV